MKKKSPLLNTRNWTLIFFLMFFTSILFSQENYNIDSTRHDKVEQLKIAYITNELNLTSSEAEKFWPIYNEMNIKLKANRKERKKINSELNDKIDILKEEDIKKKLNLIFENESAEISIKKEYNSKISVIIGLKKSVKLLGLEQEFKRELLKRLKDDKKTISRPNTGNRPMRK